MQILHIDFLEMCHASSKQVCIALLIWSGIMHLIMINVRKLNKIFSVKVISKF